MKTTKKNKFLKSSRIIISRQPFEPKSIASSPSASAPWPAKWVGHPDERCGSPEILAFHLRCEVRKDMAVRIHVSADERYELFLDGARIGRGPERGDPGNWNYESYRLNLTKGTHHLAAKVWWFKAGNLSPHAQMSIRPAFLLAAEGEAVKTLSTGSAPWRVMKMDGIDLLPPELAWGTGAKTRLIAGKFPWGFEKGAGSGWTSVSTVADAVPLAFSAGYSSKWLLTPATLPPMLENHAHAGIVRHVQSIDTWETSAVAVSSADHLEKEAGEWNRLLAGKGKITVPARTWRRIITDLETYRCAYPSLTVSGGLGARIRIRWSESLFLPKWQKIKGMYKVQVKGDRNRTEGKYFIGIGDEIEADGKGGRVFEPMWWEAGRFIEICVRTDSQPLSIEDFHLVETGYPHSFKGGFKSSDSRLDYISEISKRTLRMCSHETYMDCPYYEQLMYVGDTRIQALATYILGNDDRLPRKAIRMFNSSRIPSGLTQSRYPCRDPQIIPPFSLWWVAMVHDFAMWRGDMEFVRSMMPGVRAVLDHFASLIRFDGLVANPNGWNFLDWVEGWTWGVHPDGGRGVSGPLNWQAAMTFKMAAELERMLGEQEMEKRFERLAGKIAKSADRAFWDEKRKLYADDLDHRHFSEHSQCLAILGGLIPQGRRKTLSETLFTAQDIFRTTIYFSHYLFETYRALGRADKLFERLGVWFEHEKLGLTTALESPEPSRSDCHAWSAHPLYHFAASLAGVRPLAPGFAGVEIRPQLGPLKWIDANIASPKGMIRVELKKEKDNVSGFIRLPAGLSGTLVTRKRRMPLHPGENRL
ncbi:MAG: alpha-L-rhamnosidase C-terminal domain-containing protein [Victivallales bacterium]